MNSLLQYVSSKRLLMPLLLLLGVLVSVHTKGQEKPPRPIHVTVRTADFLRFGTFIQSGTSGTITVDCNNTRYATGDVILPNINSIVSPALFIVDAEPGTLITIMNGPPIDLTGSNGGKMKLTLGCASTQSPFITKTQETYVYIGGTLTVLDLSANPAGSYIGEFQVTFIQQ